MFSVNVQNFSLRQNNATSSPPRCIASFRILAAHFYRPRRKKSRIMAGKTVIAIAHRLSTIAAMDRIIVLEDGAVAEEGSHHDLLRQNGLYARFWARQSGGFIGLEEA